MTNPNYYAIIPAFIRYDNELKPNTKLMYGEITALSNKYGYCNASNNYFAKLYGVHKNTVSNWIKQLQNKGYINSQLIYKDNKEIKERRLYLCSEIVGGINEIVDTPINEKIDTPINKKVEVNNTSINNTSINKESKQTPKQKRLLELKKRIGIKQFKFIESANYDDLRMLGEKFELMIKYLEYRNAIKKPFKTLNGIKQKVIKPFLENQLSKVSRVVNYAIDEEHVGLNWPEDWKGQKNHKKNGFDKPVVLKAAPSSFTSPSSI